MQGELALVVPFAGLDELLGERPGVEGDLPPHVTVMEPAPGEIEALAEVLGPFGQFDVTFARLDRFPGTLWLAPEPAEPFVAMTEAVMSRFPGHKPYGGVYASIVPHLTVAQAQLDETAALLEPLLPLHSRVESAVLYEESAQPGHWHELATFDL